MKKFFKTLVALPLFVICCTSIASCSETAPAVPTGSTVSESDLTEKVQEYYDLVVKSQVILDDYADDIYRNWYDAIYNDKFYGSIDIAIVSAENDHEDDVKFLKENDAKIEQSYKSVRDSKYAENVKSVMDAYSTYYEFVVNVSGSFTTFQSNKETYKKQLASELKKLHFEI